MPDTSGPRRPKAAVLLLWYPLFTQPFIFRDVEALWRRLRLEIFTLYGLNLRFCSREMRAAADRARRLGLRALPGILLSALRLAFTRPRLFGRLFRDTVCFRWPSLEIFGENLWAFLCGVHLAPIFQARGIEIMYAPWPRGTATAARVISRITGIPYVISARADNLSPADPDLLDKLRDACAVRTNNLSDGRRILALTGDSGENLAVIYNGLTLPRETVPHKPLGSPVRLLAAGRFDVTKGFDVLLRACALLRKKGVDFTLTLVGGGGRIMGLGALETSLRELCAKLGLDDIVSFPGLVSHDAFPAILRSHDIFVAPCVVAPDGKRDGIPNTVIEAMSYGMAVVSTDVNGLPEVVRHNDTGLVVRPGDPEGLAEALARLAADPKLAGDLGARAAVLAAELFSPEANGRRLAEFLADALRRHGA